MFNSFFQFISISLTYFSHICYSSFISLSAIIPDIACFDEDGSRFVNERLRSGTLDEQELAMKVALLGKEDLWVDNYGRFVLQGLFEFGTDKMKEDLVARMCGRDVVSLCMHKNGCRVIQKAIRCLALEDINKLILKIHGKILTVSRDPNGNHVVQRLIQVMSSFATIKDKDDKPNAAASSQIQFIIDDIKENIEDLSTHCYGCRVVQRAIKHCVDEQKHAVVEQIISCDVETLICDRYGNYVIQAVLFNGSEEQIASIIERLTESDQLLKFARQKYASNIIETILEHGEPEHKKKLVEGMLLDTRNEEGGYCCVVELSKDRIANYVVNKALENCDGGLQEELFELLSSNYQELSKSRYGKYVLQTLRKHQSASA